MPKDHEKNPNNQESDMWSESSASKKGHHPGDAGRHGEYGEARGGVRGYFPGMSHPHAAMGRESSEAGFHGRIQSPPRMPAEDADLSDAMVYLSKIREEYEDDMVTYDNFLETMRDFKFGKVDAEEVCKAVRILFKNKPHLIETFNEYLPHHLRFYGDRPQDPVVRPFERQMAMIAPPPQFRRPMYPGNGQMMGMSMPPPVMHQMMVSPGNMQHGAHQGFANGLPRVHASMRIPSGQMKQPVYQKMEEFEKIKAKQAQDFIQKVKRRYAHHPNVYKTFVEILQTHQTKTNSFDKMKAEVNSLLWENPDLCEDFERNFIPIRKQSAVPEKDVLQRIKDVLKEKNLLEDFLKCINYFNQKFINEKDLLALVEPFLRSEELVKGFKSFIGYKEASKETPRSLDKYRKEGSYRVLPESVTNEKQDPIAKEVLNMTCVSCPTFESEDSNYVFLKRNIHEEALFRVEDERSEADLVVERIQYFINTLEEVIATNRGSELSMKDLKMSPGVIKEVLRDVYGKSAPEILEGILTKPQIAIPIVIKRFYTLNKKLRQCLREKRKMWREVVERNYLKALDVVGSAYKTAEKSIFTMKNIAGLGEEGLQIVLADHKLLEDVKMLCKTYARAGQADAKKNAASDVCGVLDMVFEWLEMQEFGFVSSFPLFCVLRFVVLVYERLQEVKEMDFPTMRSSETAVAMDLQTLVVVEDRYSAVREVCLDFMRKAVDGYLFEDRIRELTECRGFKLYNLKKMMSKIEKHVAVLAESNAALDSLHGRNTFESGEELYHFRKTGDAIEIKAIKPERDESWDAYVEKLERLVLCDDIRPGTPFLPRACRRPPIAGLLKQDLKVSLSPGTYRIKQVAGSESFYVSLRLLARGRQG